MGLVGVATLVAIGVAVHVALTSADRRGWVYYRNPHRPAPRSLGFLEEIYQPSVTHVVEQETSEQTKADQAESGDPESPASTG